MSQITDSDTAVSTYLGIITGESAPQLTDDGQALRQQMEQHGVEPTPLLWTDRSVDWASYDAVLFRSCWEYHTDPEQFQTLLSELSTAEIAVYNPIVAIEWNMHKSYLLDLFAAGIPIPSTTVVTAGDEISLESVMDRQGLSKSVIKPAIGASSTGVWQCSREEAAGNDDRFQSSLRNRDLLVQEYLPEINAGERSAVFMRGEYSHAWNDIPTTNDFSAFDETDLAYEPTEEIRGQVKKVVERACEQIGCRPTQLPYARVDYVERGGSILLLELELIEPYIGLVRTKDGVDRFVSALTGLLAERPTPPSQSTP
jgi:glutathione synthase/RimK-type ligase-like ATP-grasp enzyme